MPSWGRSFALAAKTVIVGVAFAVIGVVIVVLGGVMAYGIYMSTHNIWLAVLPAIPVLVIGFVLGSFGFYAALIKYTTEEAINEMRRGGAVISPLQASIRSCPNCKTPLVWDEQNKRWYCPNCKQYIP